MNEMRKLMEAVEHVSVEYRDPDGDFQIYYAFPRGYWAVGKNDAAQDISGESFDDLDDAIEHAEICMSIADDDGQPSEYEEWQDFQGGDDWDHGQYDESVKEEISAEWGRSIGDKLYHREGFEDAKNGVYNPGAYAKGPARDAYRAGKEDWVSSKAQER